MSQITDDYKEEYWLTMKLFKSKCELVDVYRGIRYEHRVINLSRRSLGAGFSEFGIDDDGYLKDFILC